MSESREYPDQNAGELGFGWIFSIGTYALRQKLLYPRKRDAALSRSRRPKLSQKWECCAQKMSVMFTNDSNPLQRQPKYGQIESWKSRASSQTRRATRNANRPYARSDEGYLRRDECNSGGRVRPVPENEKFSLAYERASLPRLSSASR